MNLGMARSMGYAEEGKRCYAKKPGNRGGNISIIGAVRLAGPCSFRPYDGAIDGERFLAYLENHLLPVLSDGDVLVQDNVRFHHVDGVEQLCREHGVRVLYLPPYAPELNPIEEVWSQVKRFFCDLAARNIADFVDGIIALRKVIRRSHLAGYFAHAGYLHPA